MTSSNTIRRVVTGHDATGRSLVTIDESAANTKLVAPGLTSTLLWITDETPADFTQPEDSGERQTGTPPPAGGTRLCIIDLAPGSASSPHRTDTIDYVICLSGEIDMDLDDSSVRLRSGDVIVQRGTNHTWVNRSQEPARIAVVLVDGKPKRSGSIGTGTQAR